MKIHLFLFLPCLLIASCKKTYNYGDGGTGLIPSVHRYGFWLSYGEKSYLFEPDQAYGENDSPLDPAGRYFTISATDGTNSFSIEIYTDSLRPQVYHLYGNCVSFGLDENFSYQEGSEIEGTFLLNISSNDSSGVSGTFSGNVDFFSGNGSLSGPVKTSGGFANVLIHS